MGFLQILWKTDGEREAWSLSFATPPSIFKREKKKHLSPLLLTDLLS